MPLADEAFEMMMTWPMEISWTLTLFFADLAACDCSEELLRDFSPALVSFLASSTDVFGRSRSRPPYSRISVTVHPDVDALDESPWLGAVGGWKLFGCLHPEHFSGFDSQGMNCWQPHGSPSHPEQVSIEDIE